jgi:hypothetical protein
MPNFSKMMGNYPFNLIRGLGPTVTAGAVGAGVGGLYGGTGRRGGMGRAAVYGLAGAGLGLAGGAAYLNRGALATAGRNIMRNPGMAGRQVMGAAKNAYGRAGTLFRNVSRMF